MASIFTTVLTDAERNAIYQRALKDSKKILFERLVGHGVDPDSFDMAADQDFGVEAIRDSINTVKLIEQKIADLG